MSKSSLTVTMPMLEYERMASYEKKYRELIDSIRCIIDTLNFDCGAENYVRLDIGKAVCLARQFMPSKYNCVAVVAEN